MRNENFPREIDALLIEIEKRNQNDCLSVPRESLRCFLDEMFICRHVLVEQEGKETSSLLENSCTINRWQKMLIEKQDETDIHCLVKSFQFVRESFDGFAENLEIVPDKDSLSDHK